MDAHGIRPKAERIRPAPPDGTPVEHPLLGSGTVIDCGGNEVTVSFDNPAVRVARVPVEYLRWVVEDHGVALTPTEKVIHRCTEAGNALRLVDRYGVDLRYVAEWREWLVWDGCRWRRDSLRRVMELAKDTAQSIYQEAADADADDATLRADLSKWARSSENASRLKAMVELARTHPAIIIEADQLDAHPWLLGCTNVTVDLRDGSTRPPSRADLLTKTTGVEYDPSARCPHWEQFVHWAMDGRAELVDYVQRALGYSLTGDVSERTIFFLHGAGRNGKSTLLEVFQHVLGDYSLKVESAVFEKQKAGRSSGSARPELVQLKGARFVTSSEMEDGTRLATALVKELTGNETLSARPLYRDPVTFRPQFKPWIAANHKPNVPADDQAIWDRLRLIPFDARVDEAEVDRDLADRLKAEAPGILAWAVRGCLAWRHDGLKTPSQVVEATGAYREEMDTFAEFVDWLTEADERVPVDYTPDPLRRVYNGWARQNRVPQLSARDFKAAMERHGFTIKAVRGRRAWVWPQHEQEPVNYAELAELAAQGAEGAGSSSTLDAA